MDGLVEGSVAELRGSLPDRTFRYRVAQLAKAGVLSRENASGGRVRLDLRPQEVRQVRQSETGKPGKSGNGPATEGGRGEAKPSSLNSNGATKKSGAAAAALPDSSPASPATCRLIIEGTPEQLRTIVSGLGGVSHGKATKELEFDFGLASPDEAALVFERFQQKSDEGDPVKNPQAFGAMVLNDVRTKPGARAALENSLADRARKAEAVKAERERAAKNAEARAAKDLEIKRTIDPTLDLVRKRKQLDQDELADIEAEANEALDDAGVSRKDATRSSKLEAKVLSIIGRRYKIGGAA